MNALQRHHQSRVEKTRQEITDAHKRMIHKITRVLAPGFKWTKANLAKEAGIAERTLRDRDANKNLRYEKELKAFARPKKKDEKTSLQKRNAELEAENLALKKKLATLSGHRTP